MITKKYLWLTLAAGSALVISNAALSADISGQFDQLDRNKDGLISRAEAARDPKLWSRFKSYDADKDSRLSLSEYTTYASK